MADITKHIWIYPWIGIIFQEIGRVDISKNLESFQYKNLIMNANFVLFLVIFIFFLSCKKADKIEECKYHLNFIPDDSLLYISYRINGEKFKLYQSSGSGSDHYQNTGFVIEGKALWSVYYQFFFDDFKWEDESKPHPFAILEFFDTLHVANNNLKMEHLSKKINNRYTYTFPKSESLSDIIFLQGVSLTIDWYKYSTRFLMSNYNYDHEAITNGVLKDSYFLVTKTEKTCDNYTVVEGTFNTKIMNDPESIENPITLEINGEFRLLTY